MIEGWLQEEEKKKKKKKANTNNAEGKKKNIFANGNAERILVRLIPKKKLQKRPKTKT